MIRAALWLTVCAALTTAVGAEPAASQQRGVTLREFVFEQAPFAQCHASTIAEASDGTLVAAWFGGTREGRNDVGIWVSRRTNAGWSSPVEVANGVQHRSIGGSAHRHPCWNPVLSQATDGPLMLFYKCGPNPREWWGMLSISEDNGLHWNAPRRLPEQIDGPVKNKPHRLDDGALLCGSSTEFDGWRVHFEITRDNGRSWERTGPINDGKAIGAIQPSILVHGKGRLQALGRSQQQRIWQAWSSDNGRTWGEMTLTDLPNPNAGTDAVTIADGRHLLVYNHTARGRTPLNLAVSKEGAAWAAAVVLENEPGEYSYPAVIQTRDGKVHVSYTWKRRRVRHVVLDPSQLATRPIVDGQWPK